MGSFVIDEDASCSHGDGRLYESQTGDTSVEDTLAPSVDEEQQRFLLQEPRSGPIHSSIDHVVRLSRPNHCTTKKDHMEEQKKRNRSRIQDDLLWSRFLVGLLCALLVLISVLFGVLLWKYLQDLRMEQDGRVVPSARNSSLPSDEYTSKCDSQDCVLASANLIRSLDLSVDPCHDFYGHVCNDWIRRNPIPRGSTQWSVADEQKRINFRFLRGLLEQTPDESNVSARKAHSFYHACMDRGKVLQELGARPLLDVLWNQLGGWNLTRPINEKNDPWSFHHLTLDIMKQKLIKVQQYNTNVLFAWHVREGITDSTKNIIYITQGGLTLPSRELYVQGKNGLKCLSTYITRVLSLLGADVAEHEQEIDRLVAFEKMLAKFSRSRNEIEGLNIPLAIIDKWDLHPLKDFWTLFFQGIISSSFSHDRETLEKLINLPFNSTVWIQAAYMKAITSIINQDQLNWAAFSGNSSDPGLKDIWEEIESFNRAKEIKNQILLNDLNNYMMWRAIEPYVGGLSKEFQRAQRQFFRELTGKQGNEDKWRTCVIRTAETFGFAIAPKFIRSSFDRKEKAKAEEMLESIKEAFLRRLPNLDWPDEQDKVQIGYKLLNMTHQIGYPSFVLNQTAIDKIYRDFNVSENTLFSNLISFTRFINRRNLLLLNQPVHKPRWKYLTNGDKVLEYGNENWPLVVAPSTVNGFFMFSKNMLLIPAGTMQLPLFSSRQPMSLNYGQIGNFMGHEVLHGFDDNGRRHDPMGDIRDWWSNSTIESFKNLSECYREQYSVPFGNGIVDGSRTLSENIADNGGLQAAYDAYQHWRSHTDDPNSDQLLPGMVHSHDQLFFLAYARSYCTSLKPQMRDLLLLTDRHSPEQLRVNFVLSNTPEFARAWQCKPGDAMVLPEERRCQIW